MNTSEAYQTLQLRDGSSFNEVKYSYRKLALELHPDRNKTDAEGTKFKLITEAYHVLKNSKKIHNSKFKEPPERKYTNTKTKTDEKFSKTEWGARNNERTPDEDWSRYTKQTEQSDPFFWKSYVAEFWKRYEERINQTRKNPYDFEVTQEEQKEDDLDVNVDHSLCIGCCSCETIAPQVFSVDKVSILNPKSNVVNRKGAKAEKILDAAQTCPTKAIRIDDAETGSRLYPY